MKTFEVEMTFTAYKTLRVEAESEEAARYAARVQFHSFKMFDPVDADWSESEITEVTEL